MTSLRHRDTTRVFAWLVLLFEDSHLNAGRRKPSSVLADSLFSCQRTKNRPLQPGAKAEGSLPVEMAGLEPATPCLQSRCSSS